MYHIGVDLGGTNIKVGIVDSEYRLVADVSCKTNLPRSAEAVCDDIVATAREAVLKAGLSLDDIEDIGVACPGAVDVGAGVVTYSCNLDWRDFPLQGYISAGFENKLPVYIANDANAAAFGEYFAGSAKGSRGAVVITLGTGVGSGVILDGKIITGSYFGGAELGHMVVEFNGKPCTCGRRGCWETYASATGLVGLTKDEMEKYPTSLMHQLAAEQKKISARTAFNAKAAGDEAGARVVELYIAYLACGITNIVNALQPEVISIGGGVSHEGDKLLLPLREIVQLEAYGSPAINTELRICTLGNEAGMIGAGLLGQQN